MLKVLTISCSLARSPGRPAKNNEQMFDSTFGEENFHFSFDRLRKMWKLCRAESEATQTI